MMTSFYESLIETSSHLAEVDFFDDVDASNIGDSTRLLEHVQSVLDSARQWLGHRCEVPVEYESDFFPHHMDDLQHLRNLSRGFRMEADVAALNEDYASVARVGMDTLELANAVRRGGLIVDLLVGVAISGAAIGCLRKARQQYDSVTQSSLIDALQRHENKREPFADIAKRDAHWELVTGYEEHPSDLAEHELTDTKECGLSEIEQRELLQLIKHFSDRSESEKQAMYLDQDRHVLALLRMLTIDLALRNWHASEQSFPSNLSVLIPRILADNPVDPFTDADFIYRVDACDSFSLYSTGPDQIDSGGRFGPWLLVSDGGCDLCLDADDFLPDCCTMPEQGGFMRQVDSLARSWRRRWKPEA